ncbi:MAG: carboxypeptidase regulatory-like domain-containing protein [Flavobacteriales bacterium]|nr:carboxypeptidase regulatory-like domain-containing protein [Flavobacteriales bacterium]MBP9080795.1 carboxypeptidase regulatory-like domain-containing protein [Flavobacteriales bacterium]
MRPLLLPLLCLSLLIAPGCKKEEGEGGKAVIKGTVLRQDVNAVGNPIGAPYPYHDQRVYIIYGDNEFQDDDVRTGPDGNYEFRWLRPGDYTIYTFGECDCPGKSITVSHRVSIDGKKDEVVVPTITVDNF